jgi:CheY-like chemotaxis protein
MPMVLVIDDDPQTREILQVLLGARGYSVETASDGQDGLRLARERTPCLILLDVAMPNMDGFAFRQAQRNDPLLRDVPVICLTAHHDSDEVARRIAPARYFSKPADVGALLRAITDACQSTR